jgi:FkbM family methyltransferase
MQVLKKGLQFIGISQYLRFTSGRQISDKRILIPWVGGICVTPTEEWFSGFLAKFLKARKGIFVDVGVNLGQTLIKVKCIDSDQEYLGFEVNLACASYVNELIEANGFRNTTILPIGLAEKANVVTVFANSSTDNSASIVPHFRESSYNIRKAALVATGDDILAMLPRKPVGVIKIDVEGAEMEVLAGLQRTLEEFQPIVTCEILPIYDSETTLGRFRYKRHERVFELMGSLGYQTFRMRHDSSFEKVCDVEVHSDLTMCDYAFVPANLADIVGANLHHQPE